MRNTLKISKKNSSASCVYCIVFIALCLLRRVYCIVFALCLHRVYKLMFNFLRFYRFLFGVRCSTILTVYLMTAVQLQSRLDVNKNSKSLLLTLQARTYHAYGHTSTVTAPRHSFRSRNKGIGHLGYS